MYVKWRMHLKEVITFDIMYDHCECRSGGFQVLNGCAYGNWKEKKEICTVIKE